jgi:hypothetical protein
MILGGATVFQSVGFTGSGLNGGCARFTSNGVLSATNFCVLFDCDNGFFGGVVDPCNDPSQGATLLDCQTYVPDTTTDDSGTDTQQQDLFAIP